MKLRERLRLIAGLIVGKKYGVIIDRDYAQWGTLKTVYGGCSDIQLLGPTKFDAKDERKKWYIGFLTMGEGTLTQDDLASYFFKRDRKYEFDDETGFKDRT